ncbi:MAG: serine hydrolase domain-containing protein [Vicinamibacterales bacterium]
MPAFQQAERVLEGAVASRVFPGAVAEIGRGEARLATLIHGRLRYSDGSAPTSERTIYDLASLTKVLATTAIAVEMVADNRLRLEDRVARWIPEWSGIDRTSVTLQDLLEHCSGLPAHRRYFESLAGRTAYESAIASEPLAYAPRWQSIYSDPGFMLLGFVLENAGGSRLDALFDVWRDRRLGSDVELGFLPSASHSRIAPTEVTAADGEILGRVHDENAAALGGVAAHAGLFGTAEAVGRAARWWLIALSATAKRPQKALLDRFVQKSVVPGSSRALGWDTMLPTSSCGTRLSSQAIGHTGFTGTSLWIDPALDLYVVLLSNRVHPTRQGEGIKDVRVALHDAVVADLS